MAIPVAAKNGWSILAVSKVLSLLPRSRFLGFSLTTVFLAVGACLWLSSCQTSSRLPDGRRLWSAKASPAILGENVVAIFMPDDWPARLPESEQEIYAQWAKTLEDFIKRSQAVKEVRRVDFRSADEVFYGHGLPINEFALLFIRGDNMALYAPEPIFDGAIYDYIEAFLEGKEGDYITSGVLHAGEFEATMPRTLKLVRIKAALVAKSPPKLPDPGSPPVLPGEPAPQSGENGAPPTPAPAPTSAANIQPSGPEWASEQSPGFQTLGTPGSPRHAS